MTRTLKALALSLSAATALAAPASAALYTQTFESVPTIGAINTPVLLPLTTGPVSTIFTCGARPGDGPCYTFRYGRNLLGGNLVTGFQANDTPQGWANSNDPLGGIGLTDELSLPLDEARSFHFAFSQIVHDLSLTLIDFREGGTGSTATLSLFADAGRTMLLASATYTDTGSEAAGIRVPMGVYSSTGGAWASLVFNYTGNSTDVGYAIDNVTVGVPEPASLALLGAGLVGLGLSGRRKRA